MLAIGNIDNIVASGILMIDENPNPMMHTRRLDAENVRVAVMFVEDKHMNDPLPIPVDDEMVILSDAIKSIVAWPKRLVIPDDEEVSIFWFLVILYYYRCN